MQITLGLRQTLPMNTGDISEGEGRHLKELYALFGLGG